MPQSGAASKIPHLPAYVPGENAYMAEFENYLPLGLSMIAGMVDVIGFVSLRLFTAHVTGNLVVIAALLVRGGPPNIAQLLAVPVFIVAVATVGLIAKANKRRGQGLARQLLTIQFVLLSCVLLVAIVYDPSANPHGLIAGITAMIAVSAMASQFSLLRLAVPGVPSTAVMTGNLTHTVLSLVDTLAQGQPLLEGAHDRLKKTLKLVIGFFGGGVAGALAVMWVGEWAWSFPAALAAMMVALTQELFIVELPLKKSDVVHWKAQVANRRSLFPIAFIRRGGKCPKKSIRVGVAFSELWP